MVTGVLCTAMFRREYLDQIAGAFAPAPVYFFAPEDSSGIASVLDKIDIAVLDGDLNGQILEAQNLRWVHCCHAGLDKSARPEVFRRGIALTSAAGRSRLSLAEHVFFFALGHVYDVYRLHENQKNRLWKPMVEQYAVSRGLSGTTMGIIGLGNTGMEAASMAKAFNMRVLGYSRGERKTLPANVDEYYHAGQAGGLDTLLRESDFVVLCCRLSDQTYRLIGEREFSLMKPSAVLINMARGAVVDEAALVTALKTGVIAGAASDVFEIEPLPAESPLWDLPNMMITPHATPRVADIQANSLDILLENIRRYKDGTPMLNRLTEEDVYTGGKDGG